MTNNIKKSQQVASRTAVAPTNAIMAPYDTIAAILNDAKRATVPEAHDLTLQNSQYNNFIYKKNVTQKNQTIIVKEFNTASYNGPTQNDFIERLNIIFAALEKTLREQDLAPLTLEAKILQLQEARDIAFSAINQCTIAPIQINNLLAQEKNTVVKIQQASTYISTFLANSIAIITTNRQESKQLLAVVARNESLLTEAKGRPNFVNYYQAHGSNVSDATTRVSIQRVIGHATPSTERTKAKLPNFVECGVGYLDINKRYVAQFNGYRHSSYPPIKLQNKFQRRQATAITVKEMLIELTKQHMAIHGADTTKTIKLNLSSLALLSPISGDKILLQDESEHRQLKESYDALSMYNGREIALMIDGQTITIQPTINIMNAASNPIGVFVSQQSALQSTLERNINAAGFNQFIIDSETYLTNNAAMHWPFTDTALHAIDYKLTSNTAVEAASITASTINARLKTEYATLHDALNTNDETAYEKQYKIIKKLRAELYTIENTIINERAREFEKNRSTIESTLYNIATNREYVKSKLQTQIPEATRANLEKYINNMNIAELYYQGIAMYIDGNTEPDNFGARYLLANQLMQHFVDFYCKSGEDRTGRMQNLVEEECEFSRVTGHFPQYDFKTKDIVSRSRDKQRQIAQYVSEFSVSRDINDQNVHGARGLQITSSMALNAGLPNKSGDVIAKMAKGVYTTAKNMLGSSVTLSRSASPTSISDTVLLNNNLKQSLLALKQAKTKNISNNYSINTCITNIKDKIITLITEPRVGTTTTSTNATSMALLKVIYAFQKMVKSPNNEKMMALHNIVDAIGHARDDDTILKLLIKFVLISKHSTTPEPTRAEAQLLSSIQDCPEMELLNNIIEQQNLAPQHSGHIEISEQLITQIKTDWLLAIKNDLSSDDSSNTDLDSDTHSDFSLD